MITESLCDGKWSPCFVAGDTKRQRDYRTAKIKGQHMVQQGPRPGLLKLTPLPASRTLGQGDWGACPTLHAFPGVITVLPANVLVSTPQDLN